MNLDEILSLSDDISSLTSHDTFTFSQSGNKSKGGGILPIISKKAKLKHVYVERT